MRALGEVPMGRGSTQDRSSTHTRKRRVLVACLLALLALPGAAGCGSSSEDDAAARRRAAAHARAMAVGRRVYAEHCQTCHTLAGKPYTGEVIEFEAPSLDEVRPKRKYVEYRIEFGGPAMASFSHEIPEAGIEALIDYIVETAGSRVVDDGDQPEDVLEQGREVFAQHCAVCHGIAGREMTGRPLYYGIDFNLVKPSEKLVRSIVRRGILPEEQMMPAFKGRLTQAEIDAVATYVTAVSAEGPEAPRSPMTLE
jgi:mono/diheme cytochrome c family protein